MTSGLKAQVNFKRCVPAKLKFSPNVCQDTFGLTRTRAKHKVRYPRTHLDREMCLAHYTLHLVCTGIAHCFSKEDEITNKQIFIGLSFERLTSADLMWMQWIQCQKYTGFKIWIHEFPSWSLWISLESADFIGIPGFQWNPQSSLRFEQGNIE